MNVNLITRPLGQERKIIDWRLKRGNRMIVSELSMKLKSPYCMLVHIFVFLQYPIICQFPTEINDTDTGCNQYHDYIFAVFNYIQEIINIIE